MAVQRHLWKCTPGLTRCYACKSRRIDDQVIESSSVMENKTDTIDENMNMKEKRDTPAKAALPLQEQPMPQRRLFDAPPSSPSLYGDDDSLPAILTDELGMIADDESSGRVKRVKNGTRWQVQAVKQQRKRREPRRHVSRHFAPAAVKASDLQRAPTPPSTPLKFRPRIINGLNIDDLSSDSELTDVPSDIGPDPFAPSASTVIIVKKKTVRHPTKSPYFPRPLNAHRPTFLPTLPFPPLSHPTFGLMQERLSTSPFRLLLATIFLNKTPGARAMPVFFALMDKYTTPAALAAAQHQDVVEVIRCLGFQNQRARKCIAIAQTWIADGGQPVRGRRYGKRDYPCKGNGRDIKLEEILEDVDERVGWEISHLPGLGAYAHDSWRMFCRDQLRGEAEGWNGEGREDRDKEGGFEPEWKRVLPQDKELRAWMTWMWLKEGWVWDRETGERTRASEQLMRVARGGGVVREVERSGPLVVEGPEALQEEQGVEKPAGEFVPTGGEVLG